MTPVIVSPPAADQLNQTGLGPAFGGTNRYDVGGTHTGTCTVTMADGQTFLVAHSIAEARRKLDVHAVAPPNATATAWVAFDAVGSATTQVLNVANVVALS